MPMKFLNLFRKTKQGEKSGRFSEFFLHAPEKKKQEVLREAAHKANEEQKEVFLKSRLKANTG